MYLVCITDVSQTSVLQRNTTFYTCQCYMCKTHVEHCSSYVMPAWQARNSWPRPGNIADFFLFFKELRARKDGAMMFRCFYCVYRGCLLLFLLKVYSLLVGQEV